MSIPFIKQYGVTLEDGKFIRIFPAKIKDLEKASVMMQKFNPDLGIDNFINFDGTINSETCETTIEFVKFATQQSEEEVLEWLDVENLKEVTDYYGGVSQLKKKIMQMQENP